MRLTREEMLATLGTRDPANNGKFIIGVLSTGIYCLPSCHARTPKPENVRFFANGTEAEEVGLRPCKKCKPDEFERGVNRELEAIEDLVVQIRKRPADFANASILAQALDVGLTKLNSLFRLHYQQTPFEVLLEARLASARAKLVESTDRITGIAYDVGFESLSVFNENFKRRTGITPTKYRALPVSDEVVIDLPADYNLTAFTRTYGRDPLSPTERINGMRALFATPRGSLMDVELGSKTRIRVIRGNCLDCYETLARALNFGQEAKEFESHAMSTGLGRLFKGREGSRVPQSLSLFDGLIWAVTGQQINLPFAFALRQRLFAKYSEPLGNDLYSVPTPERIAELADSDLRDIQYSRQKADYLIGIARLGPGWIAELEAASFTRSKTMLLATRGLGIWSANYLLMRSLGYADCVPLGDTGLTAGLVHFHGLESKPTLTEIEAMMKPFCPYRSLATYHLWQSLK